MAKAIWKNQVIAESDQFEEVEGNIYFPPSAIKKEFFSESSKTSVCPWKGTANYYNITVDGETNSNGAWYYPTPKEKAQNIQNFVAFWNGVEVEK